MLFIENHSNSSSSRRDRDRETEREIVHVLVHSSNLHKEKKNLPCADSLFESPQQPSLEQLGTWNIILVSYMRSREPKMPSLAAFPGTLAGS